jgi:DNA-binding transcriptional MerR regulator
MEIKKVISLLKELGVKIDEVDETFTINQTNVSIAEYDAVSCDCEKKDKQHNQEVNIHISLSKKTPVAKV